MARLDHGDTLPTKASASLLHKSDAVYNITAGAKALHHSAAVAVQSRYSVWTRWTSHHSQAGKESTGLYYMELAVCSLLTACWLSYQACVTGRSLLLLISHSGNCAKTSGVKGFKSHG